MSERSRGVGVLLGVLLFVPFGPHAFIEIGANDSSRARRLVASGLTAPCQLRR